MTEANKMPETPPSEQMYGIAKRITLDLEKFPLHTHAAICRIVMTMVEHRKIVLEAEMEANQAAAQKAAMQDAINAHAKRIAEGQAAEAARMLAQAKPPRMSLELVDGKPVAPVTEAIKLPCGCIGECLGHGSAKIAEPVQEEVLSL
jgi:hypothetical protein